MRPVTATCTALRIFSIAPRGSGRTGSIQPWANAGRAIAHSTAASPGRRFRDSMGLVPVRDAMRDACRETGCTAGPDEELRVGAPCGALRGCGEGPGAQFRSAVVVGRKI